MSRRVLRVVVTVAVLALLVWRLGAGPFVDGLRDVDLPTVLAVLAISAVTTTACALRWRRVGAGLGLDVPLGSAVASYYRSQLLNSVVPGGVVGDVDRGLRHGRAAGSTPLGLRAVAWDRLSGQTVQLAATAALLVLLPSPLRGLGVALVAAVAVLVGVGVLAPRLGARASRLGGWVRIAVDDVRHGLLPRRTAALVVGLSLVVVAGQVAVFLLAARAAGAPAAPAVLVPVALLSLLAMAVPLHVAGWGLREGAAAWAFAVVGLGADLGVRTAVVYGIVATAATLPGLVVIVVAALRRRSRHAAPPRVAPVLVAAEVGLDG